MSDHTTVGPGRSAALEEREPVPRKGRRRFTGLAGALALGALLLAIPASAAAAACAPQGGAAPAQAAPQPSPAEVDPFHPDNRPRQDGTRPPQPRPALGGSVTVHMELMPDHLNYPLTNAAYSRRILQEVSETLLRRDPQTLQWRPRIARAYVLEDALVLTPEAAARLGPRALTIVRRPLEGEETPREPLQLVYGAVEEAGEGWRVSARSPENPLGEPLELASEDVREHLRQSVVTFELRPDVRWHDGHGLDARDVQLSWELYTLPGVNCSQRRWQFEKVAACDLLDARTVRFVFGEQYFQVLSTLGDMTLLPAHVFDLRDPDHAARKPDASQKELAANINVNKHNREWIGLGPYRIVEYGAQTVRARRFAGYFDPAEAGYLDELVWRAIPDDSAAFQALLSGELQFFDRLQSDDFFGAATESPAFTDKLYKGYFYPTIYGFVAWNTLRPGLSDARVRRALGRCFDLHGFARTYYKGLVNVVTGPYPYFTPAYDKSIAPLGFDLEEAAQELAAAGWYDRDGDGLVDKDGAPLRLTYETMSGNQTGIAIGLSLQENLERVGVAMELRTADASAVWAKVRRHDFDAAGLAWVPDIEIDVEQILHSRGADPSKESANLGCLADPELDRLIELGQKEMDFDARQGIWRAIHARVHELQPYLFLYNPPRKFALDRRLRGHQAFPLDPGYSLRRWYYPEGTPGTRPLPGGR